MCARPDGEAEALFLVGAARSGTSLLYKALCLHPDVAFISNWVRRFPAAPELAVFNRIARRWTDVRRSTWFHDDSNAYVYGDSRSLSERLFPMPVEGEPLFARCGFRQEAPPDQQRPDLDLLARSLRRVSRASGGRLLVSKRIAHNRRIPQLVAALPTARFVSIVRDGRAVAYSLSRVDWWPESHVWWYGDTPRAWSQSGRDPWELCARNWVEELREIEHGLAVVPAAQVLSISYEQLVAQPVPTLEAIAAFAGLRENPEWVSEVERLRFPDRNEAWRTRLEPEDAQRISAIQAPQLRQYAYE